MATRKTTSKTGTLKSAAADLVQAAKSLGQAFASKAEEAKADASAALTRVKKDVAAGTSKAREKVTASVQRTETRIEKAAASAKKSVQRTIGSVEKKARAAKVQAERKLSRAFSNPGPSYRPAWLTSLLRELVPAPISQPFPQGRGRGQARQFAAGEANKAA